MGERGNYVPDLTTVEVHDDAEVLELMDMADSVRAAASTDMNEHSSRSHMLLSVHVATLHKSSGMRTFSKLHLVDLAGSERINKSNPRARPSRRPRTSTSRCRRSGT